MTWKIYFHIHWLFIVQAIDSRMELGLFYIAVSHIRYIEGFVTSICIIRAGTNHHWKLFKLIFMHTSKRILETVENLKGSLITLYMLNYIRKKIYCSYGFSIFVDILLQTCAIKSHCYGIYIWSHIKVTSPINLWPALVYPRLQPDWTLSLWHYNVYKLNQINKCNLSYTVRAQFVAKNTNFFLQHLYLYFTFGWIFLLAVAFARAVRSTWALHI